MDGSVSESNPWRRITLVIDESSASEPALRFCVAVARPLGAEVTVLCMARARGRAAHADTARGRRVAAAVACRLGSEGVLARSHVRIAAAPDVPLAIADASQPADLVVIGVGSDGMAAELMGALGDGVIARCGCPVLSIPDATVREPVAIRRIILAVSDRPSPAAVEAAAVVARAFDAEVLVWHAARTLRPGRYRLRPARRDRSLDPVSRLLRERRVEFETAVVEARSAIPDRLADAAASWAADLLVIGSGVRSGPGRALPGGGRGLRRVAPLPVLVARRGLPLARS
jgi:nucleotide-binding universal stress UspA family protein